jgi:hypothetical protein
VSHVLTMTAIENGAPMVLVVQFESSDDAMHKLTCQNRER